jgi:small subunit ribosomal protein S9
MKIILIKIDLNQKINMPRTKKKNYIYAKGRRKEASARVRLIKGKGEILVNDKPFNQYFTDFRASLILEKLFKVIDISNKYYATVRVEGGGRTGQLEAVILGLARAFSALDKDKYKLLLKKAGFLTRDARIRERRKIGMGGKARRKKQSPKR